MQLRKLGRASPELGEVLRLYERAFPANERWGMDAVLDDETGISELCAFYDGELFCGFVVLLNQGDITHIIYLAVPEELRGRGYGSEALGLVRAVKPGRRLLIDIERPGEGFANNAQRLRRKAFYERNGCREAGVYYSWRGESYEIMISGGGITSREYFRFWRDVDKNSRIFKRG